MTKHFFLLVLILNIDKVVAQPIDNSIRINQCGYYTGAPKIAVLVSNTANRSYAVVNEERGDTIFRGSTGKLMQSTNSSLQTSIIDFSSVHTPGRDHIVVEGLPPSYSFYIGESANHAAAVALLKGFYFIRSSMPLEKQYAGKWARPAGHPDTAVLVHASAASDKRPAGTVIATPGGWYDAGDYNKYIVNAGISTGTLLSAYEDYASYFDTLHTNIPESHNALPDLLDEALYNVRWMLSMQDPNDGGVYNKCTNAAFDGMVMPGVTTQPRYVVQKGTAATLDFVAVMAQCSRILQPYNRVLPGMADSCLRAAVDAWQWAKKYPALSYDQNAINKQYDPKITTGAYGDRAFTDEWFWAAAELAVTAKQQQYYDAVQQYSNDSMQLPSWGNVRMLGRYTLLRHATSLPPAFSGVLSRTRAGLLSMADDYLAHIDGNAFHTVMGQSKRDFNWGSNSNAANQGIVLMYAYQLSKNKKYVDGALTNLDYVLGRNATGYCFITGIGTRSTMHPHHRPSVADGIPEPVPGLLAGGPNPGMQDKCAYPFTEPETAYADIDCAYASNEIAINWNASMVYLANAIEATQAKVHYTERKKKLH